MKYYIYIERVRERIKERERDRMKKREGDRIKEREGEWMKKGENKEEKGIVGETESSCEGTYEKYKTRVDRAIVLPSLTVCFSEPETQPSDSAKSS